MKVTLKKIPDRMRKGKWMLISFFLFAGCMQYDESLTPKDHQRNSDPTILESTELAKGANIAANKKRVFTAHLSGINEVPAVNSKGAGQAIFKLNKDGTELHYKLIVANTKNITQAHIHCGEPGVNGPVVVFLFGLVPGGVNQNGVLAEGTITASSIIPRTPSAACVEGLMTFEDLLDRMRNGGAYVNAHTLAFPGGEIRGQIR
jgi:hypothetical protein